MRPKPARLYTVEVPHSDRSEEISLAIDAAIYSVVHDGAPISLRTTHPQKPGAKYSVVSFPNKGHAHRLAARLNHLCGTDAFHVVRMTSGERVEPREPIIVRRRRRIPGLHDPK